MNVINKLIETIKINYFTSSICMTFYLPVEKNWNEIVASFKNEEAKAYNLFKKYLIGYSDESIVFHKDLSNDNLFTRSITFALAEIINNNDREVKINIEINPKFDSHFSLVRSSFFILSILGIIFSIYLFSRFGFLKTIKPNLIIAIAILTLHIFCRLGTSFLKETGKELFNDIKKVALRNPNKQIKNEIK